MCDLQRETPLFDKLLPIQISDGIHDVRQSSSLVVRIISGNQIIANNGNTFNTIANASSGNIGQTEKVIHLEITDEKDPYFLYYMDVSEQEFHILKREQSILVEFNVYPTKLIELLELCLIGNPSSVFLGDPTISLNNVTHGFLASLDSSTSTFIAKLDTTTGIFSVVEANKFKQLTHISLLLKPGDDHSIKMYLASRLALSLNASKKQMLSIQDLKLRLQTEELHNEEMSSELFSLKTKANVDVQTIKSEHSQELSHAQLQAMETIETMRVKFDTQLETIRTQLDHTQKILQEKTTSYEQQIADISFEKGQVEFKLRDVERMLHSTEADRDRLLKEWEAINQQRHDLDTERMNMQRDIVKLEAKVDSLEHQLIARDESMAKSIALQKASEDARDSIEQRLQMYVANAEVLQDNMRSGSIEIERGNQIIMKQNNEIKVMRDKIKIKSDVIRKQETLINELRIKLVDTEHLLNASNEMEKTNVAKINSLQQQLKDALERLSESNNVIASNQEVITYLNEEINKWQLGVRISSEPLLLSQHNNNVTPNYNQAHHYASNTSKYHSHHSNTNIGSTSSIAPRGFNNNHNMVSPPDIDSSIPNYKYGSKSSLDYSSNNSNSNTTSSSIQQLKQQQQQQPLNLIQTNKATTLSTTSSPPGHYTTNTTSGSNLDGIQDIYLKGIQNLGLDSAALSDHKVGLDWLKSLNDNNTNIISNDNITTKTTGTFAVMNDLESLDYYAMLPTESQSQKTKITNTNNSSSSSGVSPPHKTSRLPVRNTIVTSNSSSSVTGIITNSNTNKTTNNHTTNNNNAAIKLENLLYEWQQPDFGLV